MSTRNLRICLLVLGLIPATAAADAPFEKYLVDHGYRYHINDDINQGCAIALGPDRVLVAYGLDQAKRLYGKQRGLLGEEIEINPVRIRGQDEYVGYADLSDFDGVGYKLAYTVRRGDDGPGGLYVQNLDPETLDDTSELVVVPAGGPKVYYPTLYYTGTITVLCWTQEEDGVRDLRVIGLYNDLTVLFGPHVIAQNVGTGTTGFASGFTERLIAWIDNEDNLYVQRLNGALTPDGPPKFIAAGVDDHVALAPHRSFTYLLAYVDNGKAYCALVDKYGSLYSDPRQIGTDASQGLTASVMVSDPVSPMGFVAWRGYGPGPQGTRISRDGEQLDSPPIQLGQQYGEFYYYLHDDLRNVASGSIGNSVAVVWNSYSPPPILARDWYMHHVVGAQYVNSDGTTFFDPRWHVNAGIGPSNGCASYIGGDYRVFVLDKWARRYLHRVDMDTSGVRIDQTRYAADDYDPSYEIETGDVIKARPWRNGCAVIYHVEDAEYDHGYFYDAEYVYVDLFTYDAELSRLILWTGGGMNEHYDLNSWDVYTSNDSILVAYEGADPGAPSSLYLRLYREPYELLTQWTVPGTWNSRSPTLIGLGDGYLAIWADDREGGSRLYYTIVDPQSSGPLEGAALLETEEIQDLPWLTDGPGQKLCVFRQTVPGSPSQRGIFALRLDMDGVPLDPEPIFIAPTETSSLPRAIWDGINYVVTWIGAAYYIHANRMTSDGEVLDGDGFAVISGAGAGDLATDGNGTVAVVCSGGGIAYIHDNVVTAAQPPGVGGISVSAAYPNPSPAGVSLRLPGAAVPRRLEVFDATGRRILSRLGPRVDERGVLRWDGRLSGGARAATGIYYIRLVTDRGVSTRRITLLR